MPMRQNYEDGKFYGMKVMHGLKLASIAKAVTAEMAIPNNWPPVLLLDPNGAARTALLPTEATSEGLVYFVRNTADAAEVLTLEEDSSTTAIVALAQGEGAMLHCDGTTWRAFETDIA